MTWNPPRRICHDRFVPAETAISKAMEAVENMPADIRLTKAGMLLMDAREQVADFVDGINNHPEEPRPTGREAHLLREIKRLEGALQSIKRLVEGFE